MSLVLAIPLAALLLVPLFRVYGEYGRGEAQEQLLIALAGAGLLALVLAGAVPIPGLPGQALLCLAAFSAASLLWTDRPRPAAKEVARVLASAALVALLSLAPRTLVLYALVAPVPIIVTLGLYQQAMQKDLLDPRWDQAYRKRTRFLGHFESTNHCGNYLAAQAFIAAYLAMAQHPAFWIITAMALAGVWFSRCRAAQIAVVIGGLIALGNPLVLVAVAVSLTLAILLAVRSGRFEAWGHRYLLLRVAWEMIRQTKFVGGGPRYFRRKFPRVVGGMNEKDPTILGDLKTPGRYLFVQGRRTHNDLAETAVEYGLAGVALVVVLFVAMALGAWHPYILGAVGATAVSFLLFYPLRDAALSLPLLALAGTTGPGSFSSFPPVVLLMVVPAILLLVWRFAVRPHLAHRAAMQRNIWKAVKLDPTMGRYLQIAVVQLATAEKDPATAMAFAQRSILEYDGECLEHMVFTTYGQVALLNGAALLAEKAFALAVAMRPGNQQAQYELERVRGLLAQMKGGSDGHAG